MPRRTDIKSILIPGSGPIVIGQACEFDYSGTQACKALKNEGYRTILVNSNPATIMTDPSLADTTYIEPLTPEILEKIIAKERPDAILPTVGGQTALNLTMELDKRGILDKYGVKLIGANIAAIRKAESRHEFKDAMVAIGLRVPRSALCKTMAQAEAFVADVGLPVIIRPSFTLGGTGGGIASTQEEFENIASGGLEASPTTEILIEESIAGWKEYELEVMRDVADNVVIVCSIENIDPMGVHTGDSITVAPQQTLSDVQYQEMRDASLKIIREIGVETGGSNIQFGVNPKDGELVVIEMNPRVSRSSALASKATGFPIAKIAALLAVGYTLDEISNDITRVTPASFEPTIDYVVTKIPRFTFEKFPGSKNRLGSMMKSVGETMSIGRTFRESFQKACRSLETGRHGYGADGNFGELKRLKALRALDDAALRSELEQSVSTPTPERIFTIRDALQLNLERSSLNFGIDEVYTHSGMDPWFLHQFELLIRLELEHQNTPISQNSTLLREFKESGYSDRQIAFLENRNKIESIFFNDSQPMHKRRAELSRFLTKEEGRISKARRSASVTPVYKRVDTCAGEFEAHTPYLYSTYEEESEVTPSSKKKIVIIGGGPNRIGQGIEFDYCCCHASYALQEMDIESIMINSNPETVSTDYDTSDKLYFEPLTEEDILHICDVEKPDGVIVQFGGQTPLKLARALESAGVNIIGTSPDSIDRAEDRDRFSEMLNTLGLRQPENGFAFNIEEARVAVERIGFPVLVRPSYVLGGRAMAIVYDDESLIRFMEEAGNINPEHPILIDRFLEGAVELDVDALSDGSSVYVAGIMQHIEEAGVHSGDSACVVPPYSLSEKMQQEVREATNNIARELKVIGLLNIQYAVVNETLYVIEVNPRASRTVPFISKAVGLPLANLATRVMCGMKLSNLISGDRPATGFTAVKEVVLPFARFPGADIILGPEMKSTGEVMGIAPDMPEAYIKALIATGEKIPFDCGIFFSVSDSAKEQLSEEVRELQNLGYTFHSTQGTSDYLKSHAVESVTLFKMRDKQSPNALEALRSGKVRLVINIPDNSATRDDAFVIRQEAIRHKIFCVTTVAGTKALVEGLKRMQKSEFTVHSLQEIHGGEQ